MSGAGENRSLTVWLLPSAFAPHRGGVEEVTLQLARGLTARGHRAVVVTNRHPASLPAHDVIEEIPVYRFVFPVPRAALRPALSFPARLAQIAHGLRQLPRPDVIHVHCGSSQLASAWLMSALSRAPLVFTSHGETEVDDGRLFQSSLYARSAFRVVSRTAAALTVPSEWVANHAARLSAPFANAVVIPNGIDPSQWPLLSTVEAPVAAAWGRHVRQKGFDLLLQAWPLVVREQPGARLLLGGDGPDTNTLKAIGGPGVEFLGPLDRGGVRDLLAQSRVAVVPSRVEPFGIVALEAMATGRSVVWGTYGGLRDATGGLGTPVDPTDVQALARGVLEELRSPADASSCRHHALSLSLDRMTEHYLDVYAGAVR